MRPASASARGTSAAQACGSSRSITSGSIASPCGAQAAGQRGGVAVDHHHARARGRQRPRAGEPDAGRRAGDDGHLALSAWAISRAP